MADDPLNIDGSVRSRLKTWISERHTIYSVDKSQTTANSSFPTGGLVRHSESGG
jgi:hypothetical protein